MRSKGFTPFEIKNRRFLPTRLRVGSLTGFTLIELLVVIAIIGILASIIAVNLSSSKAKGRDARRVSDLKTIQLALETYYNDNQKYPVTITSSPFIPNYLPTLPVDPLNSTVNGISYTYKYSSYSSSGSSNCLGTAIKYHLAAVLESCDSGTNGCPNSTLNGTSARWSSNGLTACTGSTADFNGASQYCNSTSGSLTTNCYDVVP